MKCPKCGAELTNDTKFCSYCGEKIEAETSQPEENYNEPDYVESTQPFEESKKDSAMDKIKGKAISFWKKLSLLGKLATASLALFALLGLIAFLAGRVFAGIIAVVAVALVVVALLMKKQVIKVPKTWIPLLAIILSFVLIIPYFSLFKVNIAEFAKYNWDDVVLANMLPKPASPYGEIISNSDDYLSLDVAKTSEAQYKDYIEKCKEKGFTIDTEITGSSFYAYNDKGYKLSLSYYDYSGEMNINLDSAMEMETITWPDSAMAKLLPVPKSTTGKIYSNDEDSFSVYIGNTSVEDYKAYIKACEDKGFTIDTNKQDKSFTAKNADSYKLTVNYEGNNVIYITVAEPEFDVTIEVECVENWIFSKYDVEVSIDDNFEGTIPHGDKETFDVVLKRGNHTISFESADDDTLDGEIEVKITKDETIKLKISCSSFGVDVELLAGTKAKDDDSSETTSKPDKTESTSKPDTSKPETPLDNLTIENCPELKSILSNKAEIDQSYSDFASKYSGRIIEFDGRIDYCTKHGNYNTRFDYLVSAGDYDPNRQVGPTFKFEDVNYFDLNTNLDTVSVGLNVRITAKVVSFNSNSGLFYLEPVSVKGR